MEIGAEEEQRLGPKLNIPKFPIGLIREGRLSIAQKAADGTGMANQAQVR